MEYAVGLRWEGPHLRAALALLLRSEMRDGLITLIGIMAHASSSCASRRRAAFCSILQRLPDPTSSEPTPFSHLAPPLVQPASRLREVAATVIHETKDLAFDTTFLQPCFAAASLARPPLHYVNLDGEVHGAPTLAAMLLAATGIRVSRVIPELDDEATGFTDGAAALASESLKALWAADALGRPWEGVRGVATSPLDSPPIADTFCGWRGSRLDATVPTVRAFAARCGQEGAADRESRRRYAMVYLSNFTDHLTEESLVPRILNTLLASTSGEEDLAALLPTVREALGEDPGVVGDGEGGGGCHAAAEWLWDMETFPPCLHFNRARKFLEVLGVLKTLKTGGGGASCATTSASRDSRDSRDTASTFPSERTWRTWVCRSWYTH